MEVDRPSFAAANQARYEDTVSAVQRLLKFVAADGVIQVKSAFPARRGFAATALKEHHKSRRWVAKRPELS
jgi:hypothetical protein